MTHAEPLLGPLDPPSFAVQRADGRSPLLFTCDHAGKLLPRRLGTLGLPDSELSRHIAWDISAAALGSLLSQRLDACLITQTYSRLVIDVNRPPASRDSIVTCSERTQVPGNQGLSLEEREQRRREIFEPYHRCITRQLDERAAAGRSTVLVALHSFTPHYLDEARRWHMGVLYGRDGRVAQLLLEQLRMDASLMVGDNEPYSVSDDTDYTIVVHGERRGIPHVELEFRQDLIGDPAGCAAFCERMVPLFEATVEQLALAGV